MTKANIFVWLALCSIVDVMSGLAGRGNNYRAIFLREPQSIDAIVGIQNPPIILDCLAIDGRGLSLEVIWLRDIQTESHSTQPVLDKGFSPSSGQQRLFGTPNRKEGSSLIFHEISEADQGMYRCAVPLSPSYGVLLSRGAMLNVFKRHGGFNESAVKVELIEIPIGGVLKMQCQLTSTPFSVVWFKNGTLISSKNDHRYKFLTSSGVFYIFDVRKSDLGNYSCAPSKGRGLKKFLVSKLPGSNITDSHALLLPQNTSARLGGTSLLECVFNDINLTNSVQWKRLDNNVISKTARIDHGILFIRNVKLSDQGWYGCQADENDGLPSNLYRAYLSIEHLPLLSGLPEEQIKKRGEVARFSCKAKGRPEPNIIWYKNGERVKSQGRFKLFPPVNLPPDVVHSLDALPAPNSNPRETNASSDANFRQLTIEFEYKRDLVVSSVRPEDEGIYQCFALNGLGEASAAALLIYTDDGAEEAPYDLNAVALQRDEKILLRWKISQSFIDRKIFVFILHFHSNGDGDGENTEPVSYKEACPNNSLQCSTQCCGISAILKPRTNYTFWLSAIFESGLFSQPSNEVTVVSWDQVCLASAPLLLREVASQNSVILSWLELPSRICPGTIVEYQLEMQEATNGITTSRYFAADQRSFIVEDLKALSLYKFRLIPKTQAGYPKGVDAKDLSFPWLIYETPDEALTELNWSAPLLRVEHVGLNSALISWNFNHLHSFDNTSEDFEWRIDISECRPHKANAAVYLMGFDESSKQFQGLTPSQCYRVRLSAAAKTLNSSAFQGPCAIITFATTVSPALQRPALSTQLVDPINLPVPVNLTCDIIGSSLRLRWISQTSTHTPLSSYKQLQYAQPKSPKSNEELVPLYSSLRDLQYDNEASQHYVQSTNVKYVVRYKSIWEKDSASKTLETADTSVLFLNLTVGQSYSFEVKVEADSGSSRFTDRTICSIPDAAPHAPRNLFHTVLDNESVFLTWEPPSLNSDNVRSYLVRLVPENNSDAKFVESVINGSSRFAYFNSLQHNVTYRVTVTALNHAGRTGPASESISIILNNLKQHDVPLYNARTATGQSVIVIEKSSYIEGILFGICFAAFCILGLLVLKFRNVGLFNCGLSRRSLLDYRRSSRRAKPLDGRECAAENRCVPIENLKTLPSSSLLHCDRLERMKPLVENDLCDTKGDCLNEAKRPGRISEMSRRFELDSRPPSTFYGCQPGSTHYSASDSHSEHRSARTRKSPSCYSNPYTINHCSPSGDVIDPSSSSGNSRFCSAPNLLTDSGIGFDEWHCCGDTVNGVATVTHIFGPTRQNDASSPEYLSDRSLLPSLRNINDFPLLETHLIDDLTRENLVSSSKDASFSKNFGFDRLILDSSSSSRLRHGSCDRRRDLGRKHSSGMRKSDENRIFHPQNNATMTGSST